tara:strand:- start:26974 stop:27639 length:666 start_codon:yes stop_codon:yes gene_type:complete
MHTAKAVIFDMDGLMVDTEQIALRANAIAVEELGVPLDRSVFFQFVGKSPAGCCDVLKEVLGVDGPWQQFWDCACGHYHRFVREEPLTTKPGLFELLDYLDAQEIPWGVGTSTGKELAHLKLNKIGVGDRPHCVVSSTCVPEAKPAPDIFLKAATLLGVANKDCIVLEDSEPGIRAAHTAGMRPVHIPDLIPSSDFIRDVAYGIYGSLDDFLGDLQEARAS